MTRVEVAWARLELLRDLKVKALLGAEAVELE